MILAFGPVTFESTFDPILDSAHLERLKDAAGPPASRRHGPWPRQVRRLLSVEVTATGGAPDGPRFREARDGLEFAARGSTAEGVSGAWRLRLDPSLQPGEMMDQVILTLAAAGVATMLEEDLGVVLHASASAQDGRAWAFPAPHATGKSTVVDLLDPDLKISDDLTSLVRGDDHNWRAGGVNASGTGTLPVGALLFLRRGDQTALGPELSAAESLRLAIRNAVLFPGSPTLSTRLMDRLTEIVDAVPCRVMDFSLDDLSPDRFRRLACLTT